MKHTLTILCAAGTALVLAVSFALPRAVSSLRDRQLARQVTAYSTDSVHFQSSGDISDTIKLVATGYSVLYVDASYARMTPSDAYAAAKTALDELAQADIFQGSVSDFTSHTTSPMMVFTNNYGLAPSASESSASGASAGSDAASAQSAAASSAADADSLAPTSPFSARVSAVIWECTMNTKDGSSLYMQLDDATGKMLSVSYWTATSSSLGSTAERWRALHGFCDRSAAFFTSYYGQEAGDVVYSDYPDSATLPMTLSSGGTVSLSITYTQDSFYFWFS